MRRHVVLARAQVVQAEAAVDQGQCPRDRMRPPEGGRHAYLGVVQGCPVRVDDAPEQAGRREQSEDVGLGFAGGTLGDLGRIAVRLDRDSQPPVDRHLEPALRAGMRQVHAPHRTRHHDACPRHRTAARVQHLSREHDASVAQPQGHRCRDISGADLHVPF